jgi:hypothetical protein
MEGKLLIFPSIYTFVKIRELLIRIGVSKGKNISGKRKLLTLSEDVIK